MKVRAHVLKDEERIEILDALYTASASISGRVAMKAFLRDLLTESERLMLGRRILIARDLLTQKTYDEIVEERRVGRDTITRVARWLDDQMPGYEKAIAGMEKEFKDRKARTEDRQLYATSILYRLKKKYPLHFLLFPTPKLKK